MKKITSILKKNYAVAFFIAFIIVDSIILHITLNQYSHFNPINGDFQNYNVFRRLFDGQIPYKDFPLYLGFGTLYLSSFFLLIFGNTFITSVIITNIVCSISALLLFYLICKLIVKDTNISIIITLVFNSLFNHFINYHDLDIMKNSYRGGRILIVIISALLLLKLYDIFFLNKRKLKEVYTTILCSIFACVLFLWSNDYGVAAFGAFSLMFGAVIVNKTRELPEKKFQFFISNILLYTIFSITIITIMILIFTKGHFAEYIEYSANTADYQFWYYGFKSSKILLWKQITQDRMSILYLASFVYSFVNLAFVAFKKDYLKENKYKCILSYVILAFLFSGIIYAYGSGGLVSIQYMEVIMNMILATLISSFLLEKIIYPNINQKNKKKYVAAGIALMVLSVGFSYHIHSDDIEDVDNFMIYQIDEDDYFEELGTYLYPRYSDELKILKEHIDGEKVFSTYASAYEVMTDQFQPTGTDYIIHVFGEEKREDYVNELLDNDYKYVLTQSESVTFWETWLERVNWYFYRHLYDNYTPEKTILYNDIWVLDKQETIVNDSKISLVELDKGNVKLVVETSNEGNLIADVCISYYTEDRAEYEKKQNRIMRRLTWAEDETMSYNLPYASDEYYIPVYIEDGYGEVELGVSPANSSNFFISDYSVENLYSNRKNYFDCE